MKKEDINEIKVAPWQPTYKWFAKVAGIVLGVLIIAFFVLNIVLKPYMRPAPKVLIPWLVKDKTEVNVPFLPGNGNY